jgi:hypothetical protein
MKVDWEFTFENARLAYGHIRFRHQPGREVALESARHASDIALYCSHIQTGAFTTQAEIQVVGRHGEYIHANFSIASRLDHAVRPDDCGLVLSILVFIAKRRA